MNWKNHRKWLLVAAMSVCGSWVSSATAQTTRPARPNVLIIYSDDVGWGDLSCYGATRVATPELDKLAAAGIRFTDAHTTASVCTPSRLSILTGMYSARDPRARILPADAPLLIAPGSPTLPKLLHDSGYVTGCIGKWHLGLGQGNVDWNKEISPGPLEVGFDESIIVPATPDRVPCTYVRGHQIMNLQADDPIAVSYEHQVGHEPTGMDHPELLRYGADAQHSGTIVDHISRIGWMSGGHSAWWTDEEMAKSLTGWTDDFLTRHANQPFFLYFAINDVHVPRAPNPQFVGKSGCGLRGDQVEELDWVVGNVMAKLRELHLEDNTLVIFSSDNGPILLDGYKDGSAADAHGHRPAGPFRGGKYQIYEGGTRVPMITYWPGHVKPGVSDQLVSQVDYLNSIADLCGVPLPANAGPDSLDLLPALLDPAAPGRENFIEQAPNLLAIREKNWKYIPAGQRAKIKRLEEGDKDQGPLADPGGQLYDLSTDIAEAHNVIQKHEDIARHLAELLKQQLQEPMTRPPTASAGK